MICSDLYSMSVMSHVYEAATTKFLIVHQSTKTKSLLHTLCIWWLSLLTLLVNSRFVCFYFNLMNERINAVVAVLSVAAVFGCADLLPVDKDVSVTRLGDTAIVRCPNADQVFVLTCTNGRWIGSQQSNCTATSLYPIQSSLPLTKIGNSG